MLMMTWNTLILQRPSPKALRCFACSKCMSLVTYIPFLCFHECFSSLRDDDPQRQLIACASSGTQPSTAGCWGLGTERQARWGSTHTFHSQDCAIDLCPVLMMTEKCRLVKTGLLVYFMCEWLKLNTAGQTSQKFRSLMTPSLCIPLEGCRGDHPHRLGTARSCRFLFGECHFPPSCRSYTMGRSC